MLRVKVVDRGYEWVTGDERTYLRIALADESGVRPGILYSLDENLNFEVGTCLIIRDFYFKNGTVMINKASKCYV